MIEDLARAAALAARTSLAGWSPDQQDSIDRLAEAIGEAVAAGMRREAEVTARHTAMAMEGQCDPHDPLLHWQV